VRDVDDASVVALIRTTDAELHRPLLDGLIADADRRFGSWRCSAAVTARTRAPRTSPSTGTASPTTAPPSSASRPADAKRPATVRPHRRARHPQRRFHRPLGETQRPVPPHRKQAAAQRDRRRPRAHWRRPAATRRGSDAHRLYRPLGSPAQEKLDFLTRWAGETPPVNAVNVPTGRVPED
jgi:hypothetical protein